MSSTDMPDQVIVKKIISLESKSAVSRYQAAELITAELERGITTRKLALAIGKSPGHPSRARRAYLAILDDPELHPEDFHEVYKGSSRPKAAPTWERRLVYLRAAINGLVRDGSRSQMPELEAALSSGAARAHAKGRKARKAA